MQVSEEDLSGREVQALLRAHRDDMMRNSPPGYAHALDLPALRAADVTFWTARDGAELLGCGPFADYHENEFSRFMTRRLG